MPEVPISELDRELLCTSCGWTGLLGATNGPNQERNFILETDKNQKDHMFWAIFHNYYCPDCFDYDKKEGNIVKRTKDDEGKLSDEQLEKIRGMTEAEMNATMAKFNL